MSTEATQETRTSETGKKLTLRNYLAYGAGDAANNLAFQMAMMFLMLYYTNVVGVTAAAIGTMFLLVRFLDAFTDLAAGRIIDAKKPGKLGKFRPFILWCSLPLLLSNWAIYSAESWFPNLSTTGAIVYMYVTYILMGSIFYTIVNIAYGSMAPALTQNPVERSKLATFRMYGAAVAIMALAAAVAPQIRGQADDPAALQQALFVTTGAVVVIGMALYLFFVFNTKENVYRDPTPVSLKDSLRTLTTNKPLIWLSTGSVLFLTGFTALGTLGSYIAIYVQQDAAFIAYNVFAQTAGLLVVGPLIPTVVRTIGKRSGYVLFGIVTIIGAAVLAFSPLAEMPWLGVVSYFLMGIGIFGINTLMWALEADTVEYGEWKTGNRTEGTTYAVFSFTRKAGQALGGFVGGLALTWVGFSADAASSGQAQAAGVSGGIQLWTAVILSAAAVLSIAVMAFYPLTEKRFAEITAEIAARRAEEVGRPHT